MTVKQLKQLADVADAEANKTDGARHTHFSALAMAYKHAAEIVDSDGAVNGAEFVEEVVEAAVKFCRSNCFHGRKDGIGEASECSICPLARWTLGADAVDDDDDRDESAAMIKRRQERAATEAQQALGRLANKGADTFAADNRLVRQGSDQEVGERTVGYKVIE